MAIVVTQGLQVDVGASPTIVVQGLVAEGWVAPPINTSVTIAILGESTFSLLAGYDSLSTAAGLHYNRLLPKTNLRGYPTAAKRKFPVP
jgi:hypothetical protein